VPPLTGVIGATFLGQPLGAAAWAGLVLATLGVVLTKGRPAPRVDAPRLVSLAPGSGR